MSTITAIILFIGAMVQLVTALINHPNALEAAKKYRAVIPAMISVIFQLMAVAFMLRSSFGTAFILYSIATLTTAYDYIHSPFQQSRSDTVRLTLTCTMLVLILIQYNSSVTTANIHKVIGEVNRVLEMKMDKPDSSVEEK